MKKPEFPRVGMRTIKTILAIFACLSISALLGQGEPIYALIAAVLTMRDTVANSVSFGIARLISIAIGGSIGLAFHALGVNSLPPYFSIPIICAGAFLALYITLVIKNPTATAYALIMLLIVFYGPAGDQYELVLRRIIETIGGVVIAVVINKYVNFGRLTINDER